MIKLIRDLSENKRTVEILFSLLLLFLPFGSYILSFSIGFMTVYPYLVILCIICGIGIFRVKELKSRIGKLYLIFLCFWLLYAVAFVPFVEGTKEAIIDIRSIILMLMTSFALIITEHLIGFEKWREIMLRMLKLFFVLLFIFALVEMMSGIHFVGNFTHKIVDRGIIDQLVYTPIFLLDNPNNVVSYMLLLAMIIVVLEPDSPQSKWIRWSLLLACFLVSYISYARIGNLLIFGLSISFLAKDIYDLYKTKFKMTLVMALAMFSIMTIIFVKETKYFGPIWSENKGNTVKNDLEEVIVMDHFDRNLKDHKSMDSIQYNSTQIRISLIKNGIDFLKRSHYIGVGPGQFRYFELIDDKPYFTSTVVGAHFWLIELISQYGVLIFVVYASFLFWILYIAIFKRKFIGSMSFKLILALILFWGVSIMPSGFLILDMNWIFVAALIIIAGHLTHTKTVID